MFRKSLVLAWNNHLYVGGAVLAELVVLYLEESGLVSGNMSFVSILVWATLAFKIHADILLGPNFDEKQIFTRNGGFLLRVFGLLLIPLIVSVASVIYVINQDKGVIMLVAVASSLLSFGVTILLIGTILPAWVLNHERGLGRAIARGLRMLGYTLPRLLFGPALISTLLLIVVFLGTSGILSIPVEPFSEFGDFSLSGLIVFMGLMTVSAWGTVMTAIILSEAYLLDLERTGNLPGQELSDSGPVAS